MSTPRIASALAGVTLASGCRRSLAGINGIALEDHRPEVVSSCFMARFIGNSIRRASGPRH